MVVAVTACGDGGNVPSPSSLPRFGRRRGSDGGSGERSANIPSLPSQPPGTPPPSEIRLERRGRPRVGDDAGRGFFFFSLRMFSLAGDYGAYEDGEVVC